MSGIDVETTEEPENVADQHDGPISDDADNPWHGIPQELLDGKHSYDIDSAGGCG